MTKRMHKQPNLDRLLTVPWWVSAAIAAGVYITFQWIVPAIPISSPPFSKLGVTLKPFGILFAGVFGVLAAVLYFKHRLAKSEKFVRLLEPHFSIPVLMNRQIIPATDLAEKAPNELSNELDDGLARTRTNQWSLELLRQIEWRRVEELTAAYFREETFRAETNEFGADGGIDVKLFEKGKQKPYAIVQCKAWVRKVGIKPIRELLGVMTHEKVPRGIFVTTGDYTDDAISFAKRNPIILITGEMLVNDILSFSDDAKTRLMNVATEGDYTTPTCPSCGIKMTLRSSDRGDFWGCTNYPRCKQKFFGKVEAE